MVHIKKNISSKRKIQLRHHQSLHQAWCLPFSSWPPSQDPGGLSGAPCSPSYPLEEPIRTGGHDAPSSAPSPGVHISEASVLVVGRKSWSSFKGIPNVKTR